MRTRHPTVTWQKPPNPNSCAKACKSEGAIKCSSQFLYKGKANKYNIDLRMQNINFLSWLLLLLASIGHAQETADYGVDVSFPIHHFKLKDGPLGDRSGIYEEFMAGCRKFYGKKASSCDEGEKGRLAMSLRQTQSMVVRMNCSHTRLDQNGP